MKNLIKTIIRLTGGRLRGVKAGVSSVVEKVNDYKGGVTFVFLSSVKCAWPINWYFMKKILIAHFWRILMAVGLLTLGVFGLLCAITDDPSVLTDKVTPNLIAEATAVDDELTDKVTPNLIAEATAVDDELSDNVTPNQTPEESKEEAGTVNKNTSLEKYIVGVVLTVVVISWVILEFFP
jgi:hypothetical protein